MRVSAELARSKRDFNHTEFNMSDTLVTTKSAPCLCTV